MSGIVFRIFKFLIRPLVGTGLGCIKPLLALYKSLSQLTIPEQGCIVSVNDCLIKVRIDEGRHIDGVTQQFIFKHEYEVETTKAFKEVVKEGMRVLDIGANIGYFTLLASKLVGDRGKVWAFEPESVNLVHLKENIELNDLKNVEVSSCAVSEFAGEADLYVSREEPGAHSLIDCRSPNYDIVRVHTVKLDDLFNDTCIDFIKSDTEGNDMKVLLGAKRLITENPDIKLIVELYPPGLIASQYSPEQFWALLEEYGFKSLTIMDELEKTTKEGNLEMAMEAINRHEFSVNLLCTKS